MRRFEAEWELLVATRGWLGQRGFRLVESRGPEGMDQGLDVYVGESVGIRIVADRSQWFVEARPNGPTPNWFSLESWSVCLGAPVVFHDARPRVSDTDWQEVIANSWWLRPQIEYLRSHLADIEEACGPTRIERTVECLADTR